MSTHPENTLRILIASDNHVGYAERDPIRGNDSATTFDEIMQLARTRDVDLVLLGGDLFHDNKPSRKSLYQVMKSLRTNCLGDKPCEFQVLNAESVSALDPEVSHVNCEDMDINVAIPVFSIHGNHDDPSGEGRMCALDILQVSGLVNYYGRVPENDDITVMPICLQKGTTKLALYGLSNVRDERLYRSFKAGNVRFMRPSSSQDKWFNIIAVHQNHTPHSETNYLPENSLHNFFDLVLWGHEHECLIDPARNTEQNFDVIQPGSSVATSLIAAEAVQKHVGILNIHEKEYSLEKIRLKTVRPFIFRDIDLSNEKDLKSTSRQEVTKFLIKQVDDCISKANQNWLELQTSNCPSNDCPLPLIRLRVNYSGDYEVENPRRFSNRFAGKIANANDVVQFHRKRQNILRTHKVEMDAVNLDAITKRMHNEEIGMEVLVKQFLSAQNLSVLAEKGLGDAIYQYIEKDDRHAVENYVKQSLETQVQSLLKSNFEADGPQLDELIRKQVEATPKSFPAQYKGDDTHASRRESESDSDFGSRISRTLSGKTVISTPNRESPLDRGFRVSSSEKSDTEGSVPRRKSTNFPSTIRQPKPSVPEKRRAKSPLPPRKKTAKQTKLTFNSKTNFANVARDLSAINDEEIDDE